MENSEKVTIEIKPYLTKELLKFYQVSYPTFNKWLKAFEDKVGKKNGAYWSVKQVEIIFKELGMPKSFSF